MQAGVRWTARLAALAAVVLLVGCQPPTLELRARSGRRLDLNLTATVPEGDADLTIAAMRRLTTGDWKLRRQQVGDQVNLRLSRRVDARNDANLRLTYRSGFPWVTYHMAFQGNLQAPPLEANHPLGDMAGTMPVTIRVDLPGWIRQADGARDTTDGAATYQATLSQLAGQSLPISVTSFGLRYWMLSTWLLVIIALGWVVAPLTIGTPETQERRRAQRAARAEVKAAKRAQRQTRRQTKATVNAAEREAQLAARAEKAAAKAAARAAAKAEAKARAATDQPAADPPADGTAPADGAAPAAGDAPAPPEPRSGLSPEARAALARPATVSVVGEDPPADDPAPEPAPEPEPQVAEPTPPAADEAPDAEPEQRD